MRYRKSIVNIIALLFILLFVYAAINKLLDYETFTVQMAQSPLLTAFAGYLGWIVPLVELLIAILLIFSHTRLSALYASFLLMVLFSAYIFIILNFSDFVPCACGGVLEKMSWTQHLIFNIVFILIAGLGIFLLDQASIQKVAFSLSILGIIGLGSLILLFYISDTVIQRNNSFIRQYPHSVAIFNKASFLDYNSWYLAGAERDRIYLGNVTAPLNIMVLDNSLVKLGEFTITLDEMDLPFRAVNITVNPPNFYVTDGSVPVIFKGDIKNWKASRILNDSLFYSVGIPIDSSKFAMRFVSGKSGENEIGVFHFSEPFHFYHSNKLLQKQIDGIFDTDGQLLFNTHLKKLIYVYFYRNEYIVFNADLRLDYRGKTIDTVTRTSLEVSVSNGVSRLASPSFSVNSFSQTSGNNLYIQSNRLGRYESNDMLNEASIIDVYNLQKNTYKYSFYLHNYESTKLKSFIVSDKKLIALMGKNIVLYDLIKE